MFCLVCGRGPSPSRQRRTAEERNLGMFVSCKTHTLLAGESCNKECQLHFLLGQRFGTAAGVLGHAQAEGPLLVVALSVDTVLQRRERNL
jgi:hypothetical protein